MNKLTPDTGVPLTPEPSDIDLRERVDACVTTLDWLATIDPVVFGDTDIDITLQDIEYANEIVASFAQDPHLASTEVDNPRAASLRPATLLAVKAILDEFGHAVVQSSTLIRHLVVNKLILETENPDPRIRMRALENLGKMSDVALFTERSEVTITHQSTDDLKSKLKAKLDAVRERALTLSPNRDGVYEVPPTRPAKDLNLQKAAAELGL
jgi:hypothetical protein